MIPLAPELRIEFVCERACVFARIYSVVQGDWCRGKIGNRESSRTGNIDDVLGHG